VARLVAGFAILAVVVGAGVWLLVDPGDGGGPNLGDNLVDGRALAACLREAPRPSREWRVTASRRRGVPAGGRSSAHIDVRPYGRLVVFPTQEAAVELESRASPREPEGAVTGRWGNVVVTGDEAEPTAAEEEVVNGCLERAATISPSD
jgi:hypothetical protein